MASGVGIIIIAHTARDTGVQIPSRSLEANMLIGYFCDNCNKFVLTRLDMFNHLHLGMKSCFVCRRCGKMVYLKEQVEEYA